MRDFLKQLVGYQEYKITLGRPTVNIKGRL